MAGTSLSLARSALKEAEQTLMPASEFDLRKELLLLHVKTLRRAEKDVDTRLQLEVYAEELRELPGDIVLSILRNWRGKWWPALVEIQDATCADNRFIDRKRKLRALRDYIINPPKPKEYVTAEQVEQIKSRADPASAGKGRASE